MLLTGAAWIVTVAGYWGSAILGLTEPRGFAHTVAAVLLTPAVLACAVPLLDGATALLGRRSGAGRWSRVFVEAVAALVFAGFATVISAALWPAVAALALAAGLGFGAGFRRWQLAEPAAQQPAWLPRFLLLLDDEPRPRSAPRPVVRHAPSEEEAA